MTIDQLSTALPLRTSVRDSIRSRIIEGKLPPGARLVERSLATELGVSRVPVREALRDLVSEGYAIDRATRGIAVRDYPDEEIAELFEIRAALEGVLLRQALTGLPVDGEARLRGCLEDARSAIRERDLPAAVTANAQFHQVLEEAAAGPMLRSMLLGIRNRTRWLLRQHSDPAVILTEHELLLDAIVRGDTAAAERVFHQHLATSRRAVAERTAAGR